MQQHPVEPPGLSTTESHLVDFPFVDLSLKKELNTNILQQKKRRGAANPTAEVNVCSTGHGPQTIASFVQEVNGERE